MEKYKRIEGDFHISKDGFFIDATKLSDKDVLHLPVKTLKKIMRDVKEGKVIVI